MDETRFTGKHPDDRFEASPFYHQCEDHMSPCNPECENGPGEHIAGWGIWDIGEQDWIIADGFESEEEATVIATPFNQWAADKGL